MREAGREVDAEDLPPTMEWEAPVWQLYEKLGTQWRIGLNGTAIGLDYNPFIAVMQELKWSLDLGLALLQAIELEMMRKI